MHESDLAGAVRGRVEHRVLDWFAILGAAFLLASYLVQPVSAPRLLRKVFPVCTYTALGDVASCESPADDSAEEAAADE